MAGPQGQSTEPREGAFDATRKTIRRGTDTLQEGVRSAMETAGETAVGTAQQAGIVAQGIAEAARLYGETGRRMAEQMGQLVRAPLVPGESFQGLSKAWGGWFSRSADTSARFSQELLGVRSLAQFAEVHSRFMAESFEGWRQATAQILEAAGDITENTVNSLQSEGGDEGEEKPEVVSDVMSRNVKIVSPDETIAQAAKIMAAADTGILPVGIDDRLVGMLTDRDIAVRMVAQGKDPTKTPVREAMTAEVKYCFEDEELEHVAENMAEQRLRRLPVVNREKRLVGIVSVGDLATEIPDPDLAALALRGAAQTGGPHRQRLAATRRAHSGKKPQTRQRRGRKRA